MKYRKIALSVMAAAIVLTGCVKNPSEKGVEYLEDGKYKKRSNSSRMQSIRR